MFLDTPRWPEWGGLVRSAVGAMEPGAAWRMELSRGRVMTPRLVAVGERTITFQTVLLLGAVRMVHRFEVVPYGDASELVQEFHASGMLVNALWPWLEDGMEQFSELGEDLARRLAECRN